MELTSIQAKLISSYPTYNDFTNNIKATDIQKNFEDIETIEDSVNKKRVSLEDITIIYSFKQIHPGVEFLSEWLNFLQRFLNINKQLPEVKAVAFMIYKQYKHLYLTDLKLLFEKIVHAEYGTFYGSVDSQRILYSFMQYNIQRRSIINKDLYKTDKLLNAYRDKAIENISARIYADILAEGLEDEAKWNEFEKRKKTQLPDLLQDEINRLMNEKAEQNTSQK